jgi:parallel beta-helix repeat protein
MNMRKNETKQLIFTLLILGIVFLIVKTSDFNNLTNNSTLNQENCDKLNLGDFWTLSPIIIDDSGSSGFTWKQAANQSWCVGNGTFNNPYVIENITINGGASSSCMQVKHSNKYFVINNCTFSNSGTASNGAINLINVTNGFILNNKCSNNNRYGIFLTSCVNNSLIKNVCNDNFIAGIYLETNCQNNTITENIVKFNVNGIYFASNCHNNVVDSNYIDQNQWRGIFLESNCDLNNLSRNIVINHGLYGLNIENNCDRNIIINNSFNDNPGLGMFLYSCSKNKFLENEINNNGDHGIYLYYGGGNQFVNNSVNNNKQYGLYIRRSDNALIMNNTFFNNFYGIYISYCRSTNLTLNSLKFCSIYILTWDEDYSSISLDVTNLIESKPVYYYVNKILLNSVNFSNAGQIILFKCSEFTIQNISFPQQTIPIMLIGSSQGIIKNLYLNSNLVYGLYINGGTGNLIEENIICNNRDSGMYLYGSDNNKILNNTIKGNYNKGIFLTESSDNNNVSINIFEYNGVHEAYLYHSYGNKFFKNQLNYTNYGIFVYWSGSNIIALNEFSGIHSGYLIQDGDTSVGNQDIMNLVNGNLTSIYIDENYFKWFHWSYIRDKFDWCSGSGTQIDPYVIENVILNGNNFGSCLTIKNSQIHFKIINNRFFNSSRSYYVGHVAGIFLQNTSNGIIVNNDCRGNYGYGIALLENCIHNQIERNLASGQGGICLYKYCDENQIINNRVSSIQIYDNSINNNVSNNDCSGSLRLELRCHSNNIINNTVRAISIDNNCDSNHIVKNEIHDSTVGIYLSDECDSNFISENLIRDQDIGIYLYWYCDSNTISSNTFFCCDDRAGYLRDYCGGNSFTSNAFIDNHDNIIESNCGINPKSNNIYEEDLFENNNGIYYAKIVYPGKSYYLASHNYDWFKINLKAGETLRVGLSRASLTMQLYDPSHNLLDPGSTNIIHNVTESGFYFIRVSYSDPSYILSFSTYDGMAPIISVKTPVDHYYYNNTVPKFNVFIQDLNLDSMYYSLNGSKNYFFTTNTTFDALEWISLSEGEIEIVFFANDTLGFLNKQRIIVFKDLNPPELKICSPISNQEFGLIPPSFIVQISDRYIDQSWYTINGSSTKIYFTKNESFNLIEWGKLNNGSFSITFYVNDSIGNLNSETILLRIDIISPEINILSPFNYSLFGNASLNYNVNISDQNLNSTWYTVNDGSKIFFSNFHGFIDESTWFSCQNGTILIKFFANDSVGNLAFEKLIVNKDCLAPYITINNPLSHSVYGNDSIFYELTIIENNLNASWFSINDGKKIFFIEPWGFINQTLWDEYGSGSIKICFFANDSLGNCARKEIYIEKDTVGPEINILSPLKDSVYGKKAPDFILSVVDPNLDTIWYSITNVISKFPCDSSGNIDQAIWDIIAEGNITIQFYANDTLGNLKVKSVSIYKEISQEIVPAIPGYNFIIFLGFLSLSVFLLIKKLKIKKK